LKNPLLKLREKTLRMVWRLEKGGKVSYLIGTAHFFPYSFAGSLVELLGKVEAAIFEGPLDDESMARVASYGRQGRGTPNLDDLLERGAIREIDRQLARRLDGQGSNEVAMLLQPAGPTYFEQFTRDARPWMAFFSIWSTYLGWRYSVDMEGYHVAQRMGKQVHFLESIDEQLIVLDGIPLEQITRQLNDVKNWKTYKDQYTHAYLAGDLDGLLALSTRFPTRCRAVFSQRDEILFERMKAILEGQEAAAFVGSGHVPGISHLFRQHGYQVSQGYE
jgi:uncharacterized protein YbaP (TraB family)